MSSEKRNILNSILSEWIPNTVSLAEFLSRRYVSQQLAFKYVKAKWLDRIGSGAFKRHNDKVDWHGGLYAIQTQANTLIYPGGKTALELLGFSHNLSLGNTPVLTLFAFKDVKLPTWFKNYDWGSKILFKKMNIFSSPTVGLTSLEFESGYAIKLSCPEQAMIELCALIPKHQSFEEAKNLMQGLLTLRPIRLQELLENCTSIKAKRVFLYLADICNMPWLNKLDLEKISLGSGKRQVVEGGQLDNKYLITVPKDSSEITLEDIP